MKTPYPNQNSTPKTPPHVAEGAPKTAGDPSRFLRTDLACEAPNAEAFCDSPPGAAYYEYRKGDLSVARLCIEDARGAEHFGRGIGSYVTITCREILYQSERDRSLLVEILASELRRMIEHLTGAPISEHLRVLVAGLGNARMTADALGPNTARSIPVTRHLTDEADPAEPSVRRELRAGLASIAAVTPGVLAETGIETAELIRGAVSTVSPDLLIAVDALAARSCERLASTVQLSDTGIRPGSGVGNCRAALDREHLGCPVIALGVPTVVDSSSLVYDALSSAGITESEIGPELLRVLENGRSFFVSPKEIDALTEAFSGILSEAIEEALTVFSQPAVE